MKILLFCTLLCLAALISKVESGSKGNRPTGSKCKKFKPADIDDEWYLEQGDTGFNYPYGSKLEATSGVDSPSVPPGDDEKLENRNCWTLFTKILERTVPLYLQAQFDRINYAKAEVKTDKTPSIASLFQFYGDFTVVLTDNATFALVYGCLFETNAFWSLTVPVEAELSAENKEKALTFVEKVLKFGRKKKDLASDKDAVRFMSSTMKPCGEEVGGGSGLTKLPGVPALPKTP